MRMKGYILSFGSHVRKLKAPNPMATVQVLIPNHVHFRVKPSLTCNLKKKPIELKTASTRKGWKSSGSFSRTVGGQFLFPRTGTSGGIDRNAKSTAKKRRVFFLDVNPLCYDGSKPSLHSFGYWVSLFFSQVSLFDPVIAVIDGEGGCEHRKRLLPSYKAHRMKFFSQVSASQNSLNDYGGRSQVIIDVLTKCNVPVVKIEGHEADDVVATLVGQALQRGYKVVVASPDKDFKQLISEDVQLVLPITELNRWSFYTVKHYLAQYNCDPCCDLSLRCLIGDEIDGVPGIQNMVPEFGWKTALKLVKKHGSLENLLNAAAVRTVGRRYAQDALTQHADYLRRNYEVLALRRDVDVCLLDEWLVERDRGNDAICFANFFNDLEEHKRTAHQHKLRSLNG